MPEDQFQYKSIGVIRTPFESPEGMPIQPVGADAADGTVEIDEAYAVAYADHPIDEADEWGDLDSFRSAAAVT